jgi:hypothetical protein
MDTYIHHMRDSFEQIQEFAEAVVRHPTLPSEVMVIRGNELVERHPALRVVLQKIYHLQGKLFGSLHFLRALV